MCKVNGGENGINWCYEILRRGRVAACNGVVSRGLLPHLMFYISDGTGYVRGLAVWGTWGDNNVGVETKVLTGKR